MKNVANNIVETLQTLESVNPETLRIAEEPAILGFEKGHHQYMGCTIMREEGEWNVYAPNGKLQFAATDLDEAAILIQAMVNPTHISLEEGRPVGPLTNATKTKEEYLANHDSVTAIMRKIEYYDAKVQVIAHNGDTNTFQCVVVRKGHGMEKDETVELSEGRVFAGMYKNYLWRRDYRADLHVRRAKLIIMAG